MPVALQPRQQCLSTSSDRQPTTTSIMMGHKWSEALRTTDHRYNEASSTLASLSVAKTLSFLRWIATSSALPARWKTAEFQGQAPSKSSFVRRWVGNKFIEPVAELTRFFLSTGAFKSGAGKLKSKISFILPKLLFEHIPPIVSCV